MCINWTLGGQQTNRAEFACVLNAGLEIIDSTALKILFCQRQTYRCTEFISRSKEKFWPRKKNDDDDENPSRLPLTY